MSSVNIRVSHALSPKVVRSRVAALVDEIADEYELDVEWESSSSATFDRKGLDGSLEIASRAVEVEMDLAWYLGPIAGKLERAVRTRLTKTLK